MTTTVSPAFVPAFHDGSVPGGHTTAHQGHLGKWEIIGHLDHPVLRQQHVFGERAQLGHARRRLVADVMGHTVVARHAQVEQLGALVAQEALTLNARRAAAAGGDERHRHVVADGHPGDLGANRLDDARSLMPADEREVRRRHVAGDHVLVGVAHAGGLGLHQHLATPWVVERDLLDLPLFAYAPQHCSTGLHKFSP